eukprot:CAMPEP_0168555640 /NCGR_PEP_ID=MMETSP0413-20121227/8449_1 /TAXON_ID=136452 /ORGANISM="Filamoeba nolandi, Strain NC-AS-23-1" /LENGTH=154 /DNA_ID=CAMNT_0008586517 /DNA_START=39 /DNA_END=503 /DNA_ORIENTATION=-
MGGYISSFLYNIIACTYPVYASFKAIESDGKDDDTQWLMYWVVFSLLSLFETFGDLIIFWLPFYYEIKLIALVLLQIPQLKLTVGLYQGFIKPFLAKHEKKIDSMVDEASTKLKEKAKQVGNDIATKHGPAIISGVMSAAASAQAPQTEQKKSA